MNFRRTRRADVSIDLAPLIDVVFLLLIFFAVATTFKKGSELMVQLPQASAEATAQADKPIEVTIDADGQYYLNQRRLVNTQAATLRRALVDATAGIETPRLTISADAQTPHQAVVTAMDAARLAGITRLSFATVRTEEH